MLTYREYKRYYGNNKTFKEYFKAQIIPMFKRLGRIPYCTYMCIKYPFLYPRNRFSGKHEVNLLSGLVSKLNSKSLFEISITGQLLHDKPKIMVSRINFLEYVAKLDVANKKLIVTNERETQEFNLTPLLWYDDRFDIVGLDIDFTFTGGIIIKVQVMPKDENDTNNYGFSYHRIHFVINRFKYFLYKVTKWFDKNILDNIFILPTYTEWDAVDPGWKKAFGQQYLDDLKKQLKKDKMLYKWRITDIKEKYGRLNLYCNYASDELYAIINKYENLSWGTCIKCGKPARYTSKGYIAPYCEDCIKKDKMGMYTDRNNLPKVKTDGEC